MGWMPARMTISPSHFPRELVAKVEGRLALAAARRQAAEREIELRAETANVLESITEGFIAMDGQWTITYANAAAEQVTSTQRKDLIGQNFWQAFPGAVGTIFEQHYRRTAQDRVPERFEAFYDPYGRMFEINSFPLRQGGIALCFRDVTDDRRAQSQRRELSDELERQGRIVATVMSSITDFAYTLDRDVRFVFANRALLNLWGLELKQIVGKNFHELPYPDELATELDGQVRRVFQIGKALTDKAYYTSPTGVSGFYEYIFAPVAGPDGSVELVAGSTRDITEGHRAFEALKASEERLKLALTTGKLGLWTLDLSTWELACSEICKANYGLGPGDRFSYDDLWKSVHPDDRVPVQEKVRARDRRTPRL